MKRHIIYLMAGVLLLSACKKEGLISYPVEKSFPDPTVKFEDLKKAVAAGTEGFKMIIERPNGSLIGGYVKFETAGSAKFVADNNVTNATTAQSTGYNLQISKTNSVLSFAKVGPFAVFAQSTGVDTAYSYKSSVGDTLKLVGDGTGTKMSLVKVVKKDADEYLAGKMATAITAVSNIKLFKKYFKRLTIGAKSYDLMINDVTKSITVNYANGTNFASFTTVFAYSNSGIEFKAPLVDGTVKIGSLNGLTVDPVAGTATVNIAGAAATLTNEAAPVILDKTAATRFGANDSQWISQTGFTKEAVSDIFGIRTIPGITRIVFWTKYDAAYDLAGFAAGTSLSYGPALVPAIGSDGIIKYTLFGVLGTIPTNAVQRPKVVNTINQYLTIQGFYVIQTGPTTYDFVTVQDGNIWINYTQAI